jgi:endonuclease/exonuclease/phosphatase family metal-dependent hydrolase
MKKVLWLLLAVLTLASCSEEKVNVRWATFNMRYDNPNDAPNHWGARKERVAHYIKDMKIDVFGTHEVLHNQFEDLKTLLPDYEGVGVGRDDGATKGEYSAVFYNKNVFDALDSGTFWLS